MKFASILGAALALLCAGPGQALTYSGVVGQNELFGDVIRFDPTVGFGRPALYSVVVQFDEMPKSFNIEFVFVQGYNVYDVVTGAYLYGNDTWGNINVDGVDGRAFGNFFIPGSATVISNGERREWYTRSAGVFFYARGVDHPVSYTVWSNATANVPEPATWAMIIAGLGLVGSTLRGQRRARREIGGEEGVAL